MVAAKILTVATLLFSAFSVHSLAVDSALHARHANLGHAFAKRAPVKRCKPRPSSSPVVNYVSPTNTPATQASPSPTPPSSSTPQSSPPSTGHGKAGLAFNDWDGSVSTVLSNFKLGHVAYIYDWDSSAVPGAAADGYTFIPMLSSSSQDKVTNFQNNVQGYHPAVLCMNEPERPEQGNTDPYTACALIKQVMAPLRSLGTKIGSPAVASSSDGAAWFDTFWNICPGQVDFIALHWYGQNPQDFIDYVNLWYNKYRLPIMVTEFACYQFPGGDCPNVIDFASKTRAFLDGADFVIGYFPFYIGPNPLGSNKLLSDSNQPTTLAHIYFD